MFSSGMDPLFLDGVISVNLGIFRCDTGNIELHKLINVLKFPKFWNSIFYIELTGLEPKIIFQIRARHSS